MILKKLNNKGQSIVTDEFLESKDATMLTNPNYFDSFSREIDLKLIEIKINEAIEKYEQYDTKMDIFIAPILHQTLQLTPRESADKEIWYFLTCYAFPHYVRHRWKSENGKITRNRFLQGDFRKNTFYRLWLVVELTAQNGDYSLTERFLSQSQDFIQQVIERKCSWKKDSIRAIQKVLGNKPRETYRKTIKRYMQILTTTVFETLSYKHIENRLSGLLLIVEK